MCWFRSTLTTSRFIASLEIYAREGVDLDRSTLAGWVGAASELFTPLVDEIKKHVLAGGEDPRRRHAGSSACSGQRQDQDRQAVDLCAR